MPSRMLQASIKIATVTLLAWVLFSVAAYSQQHTVDGLNVTKAAEFMWFDQTNNPPATLTIVEGVPIGPGRVTVASPDRKTPITVRVPEGTYTLMGREFPLPDGSNGAFFTETVTVAPSRQDLINWAWVEMFKHWGRFVTASNDINALAPSAQEVADALTYFMEGENPAP